MWLYHPKKSAVAEDSHRTPLHNTSVLAKKLRHLDYIIREVIGIKLQPNNMNGEDGFSLSKSYKPSFVT
jgi:hypothetical protein